MSRCGPEHDKARSQPEKTGLTAGFGLRAKPQTLNA